MNRSQVLKRTIAVATALAICWPVVAAAETIWAVREGTTSLFLDHARLNELGLIAVMEGWSASSKPSGYVILEISEDSTSQFTSDRGVLGSFLGGDIRHADGLRISTLDGGYQLGGLVVLSDRGAPSRSSGIGSGPADGAADQLTLQNVKVAFDAVSEVLLIEGEVTISSGLADALGAPELQGTAIGGLITRAAVDWSGGDRPMADPDDWNPVAAGGRTACNKPVGPDVIVGELTGVSNYVSVGGIDAFSVGTTSCNVGDENILWIAGTNEHPVIAQNMYQLNNGRFRHVGMSWLKHGFTALTGNACGCGCSGQGGSVLGVGCSDPYSSWLNGSQSGLGPRFEVNAYNGYFPFPFTAQGQTGNTIYKRLQVKVSDLDPALDGGGLYFVESHYITADDALAGNGRNNASYRPISVTGGASEWNAAFTGTTQREQPGIRAWADNDTGVIETTVRIPLEGVFLMAAKSTDQGGGNWHYEYAVQNFNSDRSMSSFSVPLPAGANVSNIGFHDVDYHSGEPYDGSDWIHTVSSDKITWSIPFQSTGPNANALRWGTMYNFWFDVDRPPAATTVTLGLFKGGTPTSVGAISEGPDAGPLDCNSNGVADDQDIVNGTSADCDSNGIPDECEIFPATPMTSILVASGLTSPVGVTAPPGDLNRLFIVERPGRIKILSGESVLGTPFLDITSIVGSTGSEQGLLSMAFHPNYSVNGYFFVNYTNLSGNTVIARYTVTGDPNLADPGSALVLETITQDFINHNGGQLQFGPDGYLYVGMGDGGSGGDPNNHAQNLNSLLGKMLRLDVDAASPYIPPDNPFVGSNGLDEIWAYGLRNPWRFSFDRQTGEMYIGDVGQNAWEELDFQPADSTGGENYGWRCYEGNNPFNTSGCDPASTMVFPILEYAHTGGACSVTGGYVYRGCAMPDRAGTYFYADYCADWIRSFSYVDGVVTDEQDRTAELAPNTGSITSISCFGEDAAGELYICDLGGEIYKIVREGGGGVCGDGNIDPGEQCDDGNTVPGDGCDQNCQLEVPPCQVVIFEDHFESDLGWTVQNDVSLTDGAWERGDPAGAGNRGDPIDDFDGGGWCYLTDNVSGNSDVDGGPTRLISPVMDLSAGDIILSYAYWFYWDDGDGTDSMTVEVSTNGGGSWTQVAVHNNVATEQWLTNSVLLSTFVTPSANSQIRFSCTDDPNNSILECAVDAVVLGVACTDCNSNGIDDGQDLAGGTSTDVNSDGIPDECEVAGTPIDGGRAYDNWWADPMLPEPVADHPLWQYRPDQTSNPRTGSATWRCKECHGWDYKGVNGQYGSGTHRTGFPGVLGTVLTESELFTLLKEPPNNGGGGGVLNGHDFGSVLTDGQVDDAVAFILLALIDDDAYIDAGAAFLGDEVQGQSNFTSGGSTPCLTCHGVDGTDLNFGTPQNPEYLGTVATFNPWEFIHKARFGQPGTPMPSWIGDGGPNQGVADIGKYVQLNFPTGIPGDFDYDGQVNLNDHPGLIDCLAGPDTLPNPTPPTTLQKCLDVFDSDDDNDVDLLNVAAFVNDFSGG